MLPRTVLQELLQPRLPNADLHLMLAQLQLAVADNTNFAFLTLFVRTATKLNRGHQAFDCSTKSSTTS